MAEKTFETNQIVSEMQNEMGIIGPKTKITGNITTNGHVNVKGSINGNIDAKGNVIVSGSVKGSIKCDNLLIECGNMTAEIEAKNLVSVKDAVVFNGTIHCKVITVTGTINGDIIASGKVGLSSTAVVKGNIKAAAMGMEIGAKIEGNIAIS